MGTKEPKPAKVQEVAELHEMLSAHTLILTDFQGLDVKGISALRRKLRDAGSGYRVVKNTLLKLAAVGTSASALTEGLVGPTAVLYTDDDPVAAAKALQEFGRISKAIKIKRGLVEGHLYEADQLESLAQIPSKAGLYGMLVGGLQGPIIGLVGTLQSMLGQMVMTLQAVADQKQAA